MKYLLGFILFVGLISCSGDSESTENDEQDLVDNFSIIGNIQDGGNLTFYLEALSQQGKISVAHPI
jgi:hypothetical protein